MKYLVMRNRIYTKNLNPNGTTFGDFIIAEMEKATSIMLGEVIRGKVVTVFICVDDKINPTPIKPLFRNNLNPYIKVLVS